MIFSMSGGKNPWGDAPKNNGGGKGSNNPWGPGGRAGGQGPEQSDLDEMLKKAQENFGGAFPGGFGGGKIFGLAILVIAGLWLSSGFYVVNPGEQAVIQQFGRWDRTQVDSGLGYHLPVPIETHRLLNVEEIRNMSIGFVELRNRSGQTARRDIPDESLMLTSDRNIVDLDLTIQWNIKSAEDYLFNIRNQEDTIKKVAESAIREVAGQTNMFPIITTQRQQVADRTKEIIQENLDEYNSGVNITQILINKAEVHPDVQEAFQDVQSAKQDAEDVKNRAEAYREDILPRARGSAKQLAQQAEGYKQSAIAKATGDADRFNQVYQAYLTGKDVTRERIFIETMEEVFSNANKIIMDSDGGSGVVPYLPLNELNKKGR